MNKVLPGQTDDRFCDRAPRYGSRCLGASGMGTGVSLATGHPKAMGHKSLPLADERQAKRAADFPREVIRYFSVAGNRLHPPGARTAPKGMFFPFPFEKAAVFA